MQHFSPIKNKILQYLEYKGVSKYQFYKDSGITRGVLDKDNGISEDNIAKFIAYAPNIALEWLFLNEGEMIKTKSAKNVLNENEDKNEDILTPKPKVQKMSSFTEETAVYKLKTDRVYQEQSIPLYPIEATAGVVTLFTDTTGLKPLDYIQVPNLPKCDGAVYVTGNSMYPLLKSGDIIMYKIMHDMKRGVIWGEMYLISVDYDGDDIVSVKWLQKSDRGEDWLLLVSENRHHLPVDIEWSRVRALALVKASIRINSMS